MIVGETDSFHKTIIYLFTCLGSYMALFSRCFTKAMAVTTSKLVVMKLNIPDKELKVDARSTLVTRFVKVLMSNILSSASGSLICVSSMVRGVKVEEVLLVCILTMAS